MGWATGVHPDDLAHCLLTYNDAFDTQRSFVMEYRLRRRDGHYRWVKDVGKPTFVDERFAGFIASCSDVDDQRMMQEELEQQVRSRTTELYKALDREKEMNELKSRFVSMASHEFRTPLSIVLSSTSLIEQYGAAAEQDEKVQKHLKRIKSSVSNLTSILNDFLSLDKLEQGKVEVEMDAFDMQEFMKEVEEDVQMIRKNEQLICIDHAGDTQAMLDRKKLRYILVNLVSNSIKYSPEKATIRISSNIDRDVVIAVQDNGIGIPEDEQKHLFNKFFRAKNAGTIQGTGLGLTIVKRYVELMGGSVSFYSKVGEGTTFTVNIPNNVVYEDRRL